MSSRQGSELELKKMSDMRPVGEAPRSSSGGLAGGGGSGGGGAAGHTPGGVGPGMASPGPQGPPVVDELRRTEVRCVGWPAEGCMGQHTMGSAAVLAADEGCGSS